MSGSSSEYGRRSRSATIVPVASPTCSVLTISCVTWSAPSPVSSTVAGSGGTGDVTGMPMTDAAAAAGGI